MSDRRDEGFYRLFLENFTRKIIDVLNTILPSKSDRDVILSETFKPLFFNKEIVDDWERSRLKVSFYEQISVENFTFPSTEIVLLSHAGTEELSKVLELLNDLSKAHKNVNFHINLLLFPRRTYLSKVLLESYAQKELHAKLLRVLDINLDFFPLDDDLLSLEYPSNFEDLLRSPSFDLHDACGEALYKLQLLLGKFSHIAWRGAEAESVKVIFDKISAEQPGPPPAAASPYDTLLIFDRTADLLTPLISQYTYLGMLDDLFDVRLNSFSFAKEEGGHSMEECFVRRERDPFFPVLKDFNNPALMRHVKERVKQLVDIKKESITIERAEESIAHIKGKQALELHLQLATRIDRNFKSPFAMEMNRFQYDVMQGFEKAPVERLIELVQISLPPVLMFRLLTFLNLHYGGFPTQTFEVLVKEVLETYGAGMAQPLMWMEKAGLFVNKEDPTSNFGLIRRAELSSHKKLFPLLSEDKSETNYYAGYRPISCSLVEQLLSAKGGASRESFSFDKPESKTTFSTAQGLVIFFVGGVSYSEVATLRKLNGKPKHLLVCTSKLINSKSLAQCFLGSYTLPKEE